MARPIRTNNPSEWTALDGIYIDELKPPGKITGKTSAVVAIIGQFEKGPYEINSIGSPAQFMGTYGSAQLSGYLMLMGKSFSNLVCGRVKGGATAKAAFVVLNDASNNASIKVTASSDGAWGNGISADVTAGSTGTKFNLKLTNGTEVVNFADITLASLPVSCNFATVTKETGATAVPKVQASVSLTQGNDGTPTDQDYQDALAKLELYDGVTIVITDNTSDNVNTMLLTHCNKMGDRVPIFAFPVGTTKASAITKMSNLRTAGARGILAWPHYYQYNPTTDKTFLANPSALAASVISQLAEEVDPAVVDAAKFMSIVKGLEYTDITRQDYIDLKNAGIMAFEFDKDIGYKIKSGVTVSTDPALSMIFRLRMSDKITTEIASDLKHYQNKIMTEDLKGDVLGAVTRYLQDMRDKKRIENYIVDGVSMNTVTSLANGEFHILIYVKLFR